jgi:membrane protein
MASQTDNASAPAHGRAETRPGTGTGGGLAKLADRTRSLMRFALHVGERFIADECQTRAAALTFNALLATVPLVAVSFAIFSAFPAFARMQGEVQAFVFDNFVPEIGAVVQEYVEDFASKTGELTAVGVLFLIVTSVMLLSTISRAFNHVWRVKPRRSLVMRMLVFWAVLTLGPLLFGASLTLSSYLFTVTRAAGGQDFSGPLTMLASLAPLLLQVAGFSLLYAVMPDFPVRRRDALIGGLIAGILFEMLKKGFGWYIASVPTYQTIYGALATFPIFLIWTYLSWLVVMLGAEIAASLPEARAMRGRSLAHGEDGATVRLAAALSILNVLAAAQRDGRMVRPSALVEASRVGPTKLAELTEQLRGHGYITRAEKGSWVLIRDLNLVSLHKLIDDLGIRIGTGIPPVLARSNWGPRFVKLAEQGDRQIAETMGMPLAELVAPRAGAEEVARTAFDTDAENDDDAGTGDRDQERQSLIRRVAGLLGLGWLISGS